MYSKEFKCNICNKFYASYKSLWDHNKKFHKNKVINNIVNVVDAGVNVDVNVVDIGIDVVDVDVNIVNNKKKILCKFCNKIFNHRSNKCNHQKICKLKNNQIELNKLFNNSNEININKYINNKIIKNNDHNFIADFTKNILIFNNKPIKFLYYNDQVYFKAKDVAEMLDYIDTDQAIQKNIDNRDKIKISEILGDLVSKMKYSQSLFLENELHTLFINELGFYTIISASQKPEALEFRRWVIFEVLPSIRKTGNYNIIDNYIEEDIDKYYNKDCVYIINIKDNIYKFGYSSHIFKRLQHHKTNLQNYNF